jgi:polyhydroxybutyrate depolymerase
VAAEAIDRRWNVPPDPARASDVSFVAALLDALGREACIAPARVYATGFSGGGRMVSQLACDLAPRVAAIAAIGGIRFPEPCASARPVPILAFHGTADDVNPYAGGGQPYWGTGVDAAVDGWARHNGCPSRTEDRVTPAVMRVGHGGSGCTDVVLYRIDGFGHTWPSEVSFAQAAENAATPQPENANANEHIWSYFEQHPLPPPSP